MVNSLVPMAPHAQRGTASTPLPSPVAVEDYVAAEGCASFDRCGSFCRCGRLSWFLPLSGTLQLGRLVGKSEPTHPNLSCPIPIFPVVGLFTDLVTPFPLSQHNSLPLYWRYWFLPVQDNAGDTALVGQQGQVSGGYWSGEPHPQQKWPQEQRTSSFPRQNDGVCIALILNMNVLIH